MAREDREDREDRKGEPDLWDRGAGRPECAKNKETDMWNMLNTLLLVTVLCFVVDHWGKYQREQLQRRIYLQSASALRQRIDELLALYRRN